MREVPWESIVEEMRVSDPEITESLDYIFRHVPEDWGLGNLGIMEDIHIVWFPPARSIHMVITSEGVMWDVISSAGSSKSLNPVTAQEAIASAQGSP